MLPCCLWVWPEFLRKYSVFSHFIVVAVLGVFRQRLTGSIQQEAGFHHNTCKERVIH